MGEFVRWAKHAFLRSIRDSRLVMAFMKPSLIVAPVRLRWAGIGSVCIMLVALSAWRCRMSKLCAMLSGM